MIPLNGCILSEPRDRCDPEAVTQAAERPSRLILSPCPPACQGAWALRSWRIGVEMVSHSIGPRGAGSLEKLNT